MSFYFFDDSEYSITGPYKSAKEAQDHAQECAVSTSAVTVLEVVSTSKAPTLKRVWR